MQWIWNTAGAG